MKQCGKTFEPDCISCYETTKSSPCDATLQFALGLTVGVSYYLWVTDKFANVYREQITVIAGGIVRPTLTQYPDGYFNEFAGPFRLFLTTDAAGANTVSFTLSGTAYTCIIFEIA